MMCGKELAAFLAHAIAETNGLDADLTDIDELSVAYWLQGFAVYQDAVCS
jgi:hypothetical protein